LINKLRYMILLDTNVLSELMRPKPDERVLRWIDRQPATSLWISAITRAEIGLGLALCTRWQAQTIAHIRCGKHV